MEELQSAASVVQVQVPVPVPVQEEPQVLNGDVLNEERGDLDADADADATSSSDSVKKRRRKKKKSKCVLAPGERETPVQQCMCGTGHLGHPPACPRKSEILTPQNEHNALTMYPRRTYFVYNMIIVIFIIIRHGWTDRQTGGQRSNTSVKHVAFYLSLSTVKHYVREISTEWCNKITSATVVWNIKKKNTSNTRKKAVTALTQ